MAKVEILSDFCKGCGYCIKVCPQKVFQMGDKANPLGYRYVVHLNPEACTGCKVCTALCPDSALEVYK
jgi:MinD superfamily P-loop ATPase containing an inserted ferredoxin domain